jgi:hypothetical protein
VGRELGQVGGIGGPTLDAAADGVVGGRGDGAAAAEDDALPVGLEVSAGEGPGAEALEVASEVVGAGREGVVGDATRKTREAGAGREAGGPAVEEALLEAAVERVDVVGRVEEGQEAPWPGSAAPPIVCGGCSLCWSCRAPRWWGGDGGRSAPRPRRSMLARGGR